MGQAALNILTGIVIAFVSAWITVQFALRRFRVEKWWERKANAYSGVIEALHNSKVWTEEHLREAFDDMDMSEEKKKKIGERGRAAYDEIRKAIDVGAFLFSDKALNRLRQYKTETEKLSKNPWYDYLKLDLAMTENCLKDLIEIAKKDLGTK